MMDRSQQGSLNSDPAGLASTPPAPPRAYAPPRGRAPTPPTVLRARVPSRAAVDAADSEQVSFGCCSVTCLSLVLVVFVVPPVAGAFVLFSGIGYGDATYTALAAHYTLCDNLLAAGAAMLLALYLLDVSYWRGAIMVPLRRILLLLGLAGCAAGVVLTTQKYPAAPFAVFVLAVPLYLWLLRCACTSAPAWPFRGRV